MGIPFYLITFNRITGLENAYRFACRSSVELDLVILDMGSTFTPFWEFVHEKKFQVHSFTLPRGPRELWTLGHLQDLGTEPFFISDGDIDYDLVDSFAFQKMIEVSMKYPWIPKVGLALDLEVLPHDDEGKRIKSWEKMNWKYPIEKNVYLAGLDTTIAFYPKRSLTFFYRPAIRIGGIYTANHYPWMERQVNYTDEVKFYHSKASNVISTTATRTKKDLQNKINFFVLSQIFRILRFLIGSPTLGPLATKILALRGKFV